MIKGNEEPGESHSDVDPKIQYMKQCTANLDKILPIFDKVCNKTMILQDYTLSDGHVQGIADACESLDPTKINRMLFNNCGLTGDNFAIILEGIAKMTDFKALTYKQGGIN